MTGLGYSIYGDNGQGGRHFAHGTLTSHGSSADVHAVPCQVFWLKSCVGFLREPASEMAKFCVSNERCCAELVPLGIFRAAKAKVSRCERPCIVLRMGMFRTTKHAHPQDERLNVER